MKNMKIQSTTVILLALLLCKLQAQEGRITVHALDDSGVAISNAQVVAQFQNALKPGEGWGTGRPTEVRGVTDANGLCVLTANGTDGSVGIGVMKGGYYYESAGVLFTNGDPVLNRWLPWNPSVKVVLQKKGIQVPMYARNVQERKIPVEGKPAGFDLMAGDWVAPYGSGETSDFIFQVEIAPTRWITNWYGTIPRPHPLRGGRMAISFSNDGDGIQSAAALPYGLRLPRQAPLDGYEPTLIKTQYAEIVGVDHRNTKVQGHTNLDKSQNYFFRVRTKKDAQGNIVSALYGKIYGEFNNCGGIGDKVSFTYYLNPEPSSRNMEFDPKRNLSRDLKSMEGVSAP